MKFDCGLTPTEKCEAESKWHRWFAWRPVRVASRDCRWLEYVERRVLYYHWEGDREWEYREQMPEEVQ